MEPVKFPKPVGFISQVLETNNVLLVWVSRLSVLRHSAAFLFTFSFLSFLVGLIKHQSVSESGGNESVRFFQVDLWTLKLGALVIRPPCFTKTLTFPF